MHALNPHTPCLLPVNLSVPLPVMYYSLACKLIGAFVLCLSGHQGSVSVCQGSEETVMEVSHQVHDVVPEARRAQDYH